MHEQMHKIMDAKNPQERDQLMQAHAKMMQDGMQMMKDMKGDHEMMGAVMPRAARWMAVARWMTVEWVAA